MVRILPKRAPNERCNFYFNFICFSVFDNFNDMHNALVLNKTMDEMYHELYWMQQVRDTRLHVTEVIERTRSYGFAFKHNDILA